MLKFGHNIFTLITFLVSKITIFPIFITVFHILMTSQYDVIQIHLNLYFYKTSTYGLTNDVYFSLLITNISTSCNRVNMVRFCQNSDNPVQK